MADLLFLSFLSLGVDCGYVRLGMSDLIVCTQIRTRATVLEVELHRVYPALEDGPGDTVVLRTCRPDGLACRTVEVER